jgi:hypothetical protein
MSGHLEDSTLSTQSLCMGSTFGQRNAVHIYGLSES